MLRNLSPSALSCLNTSDSLQEPLSELHSHSIKSTTTSLTSSTAAHLEYKFMEAESWRRQSVVLDSLKAATMLQSSRWEPLLPVLPDFAQIFADFTHLPEDFRNLEAPAQKHQHERNSDVGISDAEMLKTTKYEQRQKMMLNMSVKQILNERVLNCRVFVISGRKTLQQMSGSR